LLARQQPNAMAARSGRRKKKSDEPVRFYAPEFPRFFQKHSICEDCDGLGLVENVDECAISDQAEPYTECEECNGKGVYLRVVERSYIH